MESTWVSPFKYDYDIIFHSSTTFSSPSSPDKVVFSANPLNPRVCYVAVKLIDDVLDFEGTAAQLGKPALADLHAGLATAPVLFAQEQYPSLSALITRKFSQPGDVEMVRRARIFAFKFYPCAVYCIL